MQLNSCNKRFAECAMEELSEEILGLSLKRRNYYNVINKQIQNLLSVIENVRKQDQVENYVHLLDKNIKANNYVNKIESGYREVQQDLNRFKKKYLKSIPCYQEIEHALTISDLDEKLFCKMIGMHFLHLGYFDIYNEFSDEVLQTFKTPLNIHKDFIEAYSLLHKMLKYIDEDDMTLSIYWVNTTHGFNADATKPHSLLFKLLKLEQLNCFRGDTSPLSIIKRLESSDLSKLWKTHRGEIGKIISKFIVDTNFNLEYQNLKDEVKKMLTRAYCDRGVYLYADELKKTEFRQNSYFDSISETSDQSESFNTEQWNNELTSESSPQRLEDHDDDDSDVSTQSVNNNQIPIFNENISFCTRLNPIGSILTNEGELINNWLSVLDTVIASNNYELKGVIDQKNRLFQQCKSCDLNENPSFISKVYHYPGYLVRRRIRSSSRVNHVALELTHLPSATGSSLNVNSNMTVVPTFAFTLLTGDPEDPENTQEEVQSPSITAPANRRSLSITRILDTIRHQEAISDGQVLQRILVANENVEDSTIRISPGREIITTGSNITLRDILHMIIRGFRTRGRPRMSRRIRPRSTLPHPPKNKKAVQVQEPVTYSKYRLIPLPYESALSLVFAAGYITHPRLVEILGLVLKERCEAATKVSNWLKSKRQLPLESDLGNSFHFHSHITCAVSKDQTCKSNPPVMMPCGHVICQYCVDKLCKSKTRQQFKCPMCPTLVDSHQTKVLDLA